MGEPSRIDSLQTLGKYPLIEKISDGYLGQVYRSFDQDLDCAIDIRVLCGGIKWDEDLEDLFRKESGTITRLQHPNIATLIEVNTEDRVPFMVMEPLGDRDLRKLIRQKPEMSFETKISIMIQVAEGVGCAHKEGILHRNLCPENIYVASDGCIKIRDFAIAHVLMKHLPHPGIRWGEPIYLSPEQIRNKKSNARSDIFALGVIFYELLTGVHPFYAQDGNKALDNILQVIQIPTFERYPHFHPRIWQILKNCLAKNPEDRYGNTDDLLGAFRGLLKEMAEDVRLMLNELQSAFASLKITAEQQGASDVSIRLYHNVRDLLHGTGNTDYSRLDQLIGELLEVYPEIRDKGFEQNIYGSLLSPGGRLEEIRNSQKEKPHSEENSDFPLHSKEFHRKASSHENCVTAKMEEEEPAGESPSPEIALTAQHVEAVASPALEEETGCDTVTEESQQEGASSYLSLERNLDESATAYISEEQVPDNSEAEQEFPKTGKGLHLRRKFYRRKFYSFMKPVCRIVAAVIMILLVAIAVRSFQVSGAGDTLRSAFKNFVLDPLVTVKASVLQQVRSGDNEGTTMERAEIHNENNDVQFKTDFLDQLEEPFTGESFASPSQDQLDRIAVMIGSGNLQQAETELDRMRRLHPNSPEVIELYRKWQKEVSGSGEKERSDESVLETTTMNEEAWNRQFLNYFARGEYKEAGNVTGLWLEGLPRSARAQESDAVVKEIDKRMSAYNAAMKEGRYREALQELNSVVILNPTDPHIAGLRREIESLMTSVGSTLTVYRLNDPAILLLDGKHTGHDGEIVGQSISAGSHEISVEKDGRLVASRKQELSDGQAITLVYDLAQEDIRPMIESDRISIERRNAMEEVYSFMTEHEHGIFRGSCSGELTVSVYEVIYSPSDGSHGFRIPCKLLNLELDGSSIDLFFVSDNEHFKRFGFDSEQIANSFYQTWNRLKSLPRP